MSYIERTAFAARDSVETLTADVSNVDCGDIGAADTFTLTPTRVDTGTAGTATAAVTFNATNATQASDMQTAIRDLGGIYADATVAAGAGETYDITVFGGYDVTWEITDPTTFTPGSTTETTPGKASYAFSIPTPRFARVARLIIGAYPDDSADIDISDTDSVDVYVKTALDISSGFDDFLAVDGRDDADAAVEVGPGLFAGPLNVVLDLSAPLDEATPLPITVLCEAVIGSGRRSVLKRSTGTLSADGAQDVNLGAPVGNIRRVELQGDASCDFTFTDAFGKDFFAVTGLDADPAVIRHLRTDGVLQDGSASAAGGVGEMVVKSPVTVDVANLSGTAKVTFWTEV
jgi:hypothetical protein